MKTDWEVDCVVQMLDITDNQLKVIHISNTSQCSVLIAQGVEPLLTASLTATYTDVAFVLYQHSRCFI